MPHADETSWMIGRLEATVSVGFQSVHRRMDDRHQEVMGHIRRLDRRLDKKMNGNGHGSRIPYAKIATILGLIILGTLGHVAPEAVRAAIAKILLTQMGG